MRASKAILAALSLVFNLCLITPVSAGWYALPLQTSVLSRDNLSGQTVTYILLTTGTNKFLCPLPLGFRLSADSTSSRLFIISQDGKVSMSIRLLYSGGVTAVLDETSLRQALLSQQPGLKVTAQTVANGANASGPCFDTQWPIAGGITQCSRVVYLPTPAGIWEFRAFSALETFSDIQNELNRVMVSFKANSGGKLDIPAPADHS